MNPQLLQLLLQLAQAGASLMTQINNTTSLMHRLQAEGRDPTQAEWDALDNSFKASQMNLQDAITRARAAQRIPTTPGGIPTTTSPVAPLPGQRTR
jgi:hypothetical protein